MTRVCQRKRLFVGHPTFPEGSCPSPCNCLLHPRLVTFEEGDVVIEHDKLIDFESACGRAAEGMIGLFEAAEVSEVTGKIVISDGKIRGDLDSFSGFSGRFFVLTL